MPRMLHRGYWRPGRDSTLSQDAVPQEQLEEQRKANMTTSEETKYEDSPGSPSGADENTPTSSSADAEVSSTPALGSPTSVHDSMSSEAHEMEKEDEEEIGYDDEADGPETDGEMEQKSNFLSAGLSYRSYTYKALPAADGPDRSPAPGFFRLFTLKPGDGWDQIVGRLKEHHIDSSDRPSYVAISYCWGNGGRSAFVQIEDKDNFFIQVPESLKLALKYLRSPSSEVILWADAICIKQDIDRKDRFDRAEKTQQLRMMKQIYEKAERVAVYLAELTLHNWMAFDVCYAIWSCKGDLRVGRLTRGDKTSREIYQEVKKRLYSSPRTSDSSAKMNEHEQVRKSSGTISRTFRRLMDHGKPRVTTYGVQRLIDLFSLDWFKRVWVLQEVAYGSSVTVHCGDDEIDWQLLADGAMFVRAVAKDSGFARIMDSQELHDMARIAKLRASIQQAASDSDIKRLGILDLMNKYRRWDAVNTSDKIYALQSLASDAERESLERFGFDIDLGRPDEDTYKVFAKAVLMSTGNLDILNSPKGQGRLDGKLPSWVPDWSDNGFQTDLSLHRFREQFFASGQAKTTTIQFSSESQKLKPKGAIIDHVAELGSELVSKQSNQQNLEDTYPILEKVNSVGQELGYYTLLLDFLTKVSDVLKQWSLLAKINDVERSYPTGQSNWDAFRMTLTLDRGHEAVAAKAMKNRFEKWHNSVAAYKDYLKIAKDRKLVDELSAITSEPGSMPNRAAQLWSARSDVYNLNRGLLQGKMGDYDLSIEKDLPQAHHKKYQGRRLARTASGLLALVPAETEEGDNIVLLQGGSVPYVLRAKEERFELIGCAYVHGIMEGERWHDQSCFRMTFD